MAVNIGDRRIYDFCRGEAAKKWGVDEVEAVARLLDGEEFVVDDKFLNLP